MDLRKKLNKSIYLSIISIWHFGDFKLNKYPKLLAPRFDIPSPKDKIQ